MRLRKEGKRGKVVGLHLLGESRRGRKEETITVLWRKKTEGPEVQEVAGIHHFAKEISKFVIPSLNA